MSNVFTGVATEIRPTPNERYVIRDERFGHEDEPVIQSAIFHGDIETDGDLKTTGDIIGEGILNVGSNNSAGLSGWNIVQTEFTYNELVAYYDSSTQAKTPQSKTIYKTNDSTEYIYHSLTKQWLHVNSNTSVSDTFIFGDGNINVSHRNYILGRNNAVSSDDVWVFGNENAASGAWKWILGSNNIADGNNNCIIGHYNITKGKYNIVGGLCNEIGSGRETFMYGLGLSTSADNSSIFGMWNKSFNGNFYICGTDFKILLGLNDTYTFTNVWNYNSAYYDRKIYFAPTNQSPASKEDMQYYSLTEGVDYTWTSTTTIQLSLSSLPSPINTWNNVYLMMRTTPKEWYIFTIGNGESDHNRSNAYTLDAKGNGYYQGNLYVNGGQDATGGSKVVAEDLDLTIVPLTAGEYVYVYKCKVTVDANGNKTPVYSWVPLIET